MRQKSHSQPDSTTHAPWLILNISSPTIGARDRLRSSPGCQRPPADMPQAPEGTLTTPVAGDRLQPTVAGAALLCPDHEPGYARLPYCIYRFAMHMHKIIASQALSEMEIHCGESCPGLWYAQSGASGDAAVQMVSRLCCSKTSDPEWKALRRGDRCAACAVLFPLSHLTCLRSPHSQQFTSQ